MTVESPFIVVPAQSTPQPLQTGEVARVWAVEKSLDSLLNPATVVDVRETAIGGEALKGARLHIAVAGPFREMGDFVWPVPFTDCVTREEVGLQFIKEFKGLEMVKVSIVTKSGKPNTKAIKS